MDWDPIADTHAIASVRAIFAFAAPLPGKTLRTTQESVQSRHQELDFDTIAPAPEDTGTTIELVVGPAHAEPPPPRPAGLIFQRTAPLTEDGPELHRVEEAGLRAESFGYVAEEYGRWEGFEDRLLGILGDPLDTALAVQNLGAIELEYRNLFVFCGTEEAYDQLSLFAQRFQHVPEGAVHPKRRWDVALSWEVEAPEIADWGILLSRRYVGVQVARPPTSPPCRGFC